MIRATLLKMEASPCWSALPAIERVVLTAKLATLRAGLRLPRGTSWDHVFDEVPPEVGDFLAKPEEFLAEARGLCTRDILEAFAKSL